MPVTTTTQRRSLPQAIRAWADGLGRTDWLALALALVYIVALSTLTIREHNGFGTRALDLAKFDQGIWNTARGRPFQTTLGGERSIIQSHFSPAMALYAPLYWIWPNVRFLFVAQALLTAGTGLLIYDYLRRELPWLGLTVLAAYLMHPVVHQVNLIEFRRVTLAAFAVSAALALMLRRRHGRMLAALLVALLSKEDLAFIVIAVGLYVWLAQRRPALGLPLALFGIAYLVLIPFVVLPALNAEEAYRHAGNNFGYLGGSLSEIVPTLLRRPWLPLTYVLRPDRLMAVLRLLWPTLFLFALAPGVAAFALPHLGYLLASTGDAMGRLEDWYPAIPLVVLYWATALGLQRLPRRWHRAAGIGLGVASAAAWLLTSPLWPGRAFEPRDYQVVAHDRQVHSALAQVGPDAVVAAQDALVPHLSHRKQIYLYPWIYEGATVDTVALDSSMGTYPLSLGEYTTHLYDYLASPRWTITRQVDGFYLFDQSDAVPEVTRRDVWGNTVALTGVSADLAADAGPFVITTDLTGTATLRVALYWEMVAATERNVTVFVHLLDEQGGLLAQHDAWPADGHRPTSVLDPGTTIRDLHRISWSGDRRSAHALRIGIYDSLTADPLTLPSGDPFIVISVP